MGLLPELFLKNFSAVVAMMILVWGISLKMKNAGIIDIFWGLGFVVIAWISFFETDGFAGRKVVLTLMTTLWGLRLALHLFFRNAGQPEDRRYTAMRKRMGDGFWWKSLISIFGLQAVLLWVISIPVQVGQAYALPDHLVLTDILGMAVWGLGLLIESVADFQLKTFKDDPKNRGQGHEQGAMAVFPPPQLFRRIPGLVGDMECCLVRSRRDVCHHQSGFDYISAVTGFRCPVNGEKHFGAPAGISGIHPKYFSFYSMVSQANLK